MSHAAVISSEDGGFSPSAVLEEAFSGQKVRLLCTPDREDSLHGRIFFLSYMDSSISAKDLFEEGLREVFRRRNYTDVRFYGCREQDAHGKINYHVMINAGRNIHFRVSKAREAFLVEGNSCTSLEVFSRPKLLSVEQIVNDHVRFCEEEMGGDCFGQLPIIPPGQRTSGQFIRHMLGLVDEYKRGQSQ